MVPSKNTVSKYYFWEGEQHDPHNPCSRQIKNILLRFFFEWEFLTYHWVSQSSIVSRINVQIFGLYPQRLIKSHSSPPDVYKILNNPFRATNENSFHQRRQSSFEYYK